jgi:aminoglycoside phosphotransferase family enzyme/predicted kinase
MPRPPEPTGTVAEGASDQARLLEALSRPAVFGPGCSRVECLETHISYVLLTGTFAYKVKKAVDFGFLDFTTLAARRKFCEEELRLNRRLAPALYLEVVPITGSIDAPVVGGFGEPLEYAVKMREFAQDALASRMLARGELSAADIDALAEKAAAFHAAIGVAGPQSPFGAPGEVLRVARQNFAQLRPRLATPEEREELEALSTWTEREYAARYDAFQRRREQGFIRECHGDLHLGNIARIDGELTIFDCIEFNPSMRWIDVMNEAAFAVMDLEDRGRGDLAYRFLSAYLERTGDYAGLAVLPFYLVYRALVRAKIARLRAAQLEAGDVKRSLLAEYRGYVTLARGYARPRRPGVVITHGLAGSGKTTLSGALLEMLGAVRVRSDVERKRMHGLGALERRSTGVESGLYAAEATEATYGRLTALARDVLTAGITVIVDATFLARRQRDRFRDLARELGAAFAIVDFTANEPTLRARVARRAAAGSDASDADLAVLEHQLATREPLADDERVFAVPYDAEAPLDAAREPLAWAALRERLESPEGIELRAKLAFLLQPANYPEPTSGVEAIETHMSWVFLTERHAWKLKKPVRTQYLDFSTETARRLDCEEELRLNARLSDGVYLATVPLAADANGRLRIGGDGSVVDWLVKMRRLPAARMLDRMIRDRSVDATDVRRAVERLARFYREGTPIVMTPEAYRAHFAAEIAGNRRELVAPAYGLPAALVETVCSRLQAFLDRSPGLFDARVREGRIVEVHGDLRPEHICLEPRPQIIDCLEFSRELRVLDAADEIGFLALECERLGAPDLAPVIFAAYAGVAADAPPESLVRFYQSHRACVRAKIAVRHLDDPGLRGQPRWMAQALDYLRLAEERSRPAA